jgi:hypothetical protein
MVRLPCPKANQMSSVTRVPSRSRVTCVSIYIPLYMHQVRPENPYMGSLFNVPYVTFLK